jgi:glycerol kinase
MLLAIDQGTTGTRCVVLDEQARPRAAAYREHRQLFPRPGWVEHDPLEIWEATQAVCRDALEGARVPRGGLRAVGITNQRETICVWDPRDGAPLHNAIVWQDRRTARRCEELRKAGYEELVRARTGLVLDPYFSATKIEWLLGSVRGLRERVHSGTAVFGTVDSWLAYKLTGEHLTDASNAARTLLFDIERRDWDPELLALFDVPERALPRVCGNAGPLAITRPEALHGHAVPLAGMAGDQQAALFGQACVNEGMAKNTYGTGSFVLLNAGAEPPRPVSGLLCTLGWDLEREPALDRVPGGARERAYALEAAIFVTGAAVQWLRDGLGVIASARETEALAASLGSNDGVYFVPALTGLGSPHWDPHARGAIVGLTRGSSRAHLARAALEAIAYQTVDALEAMRSAGAYPLSELRADGGASENAWLMQFQADVLGVPVVVPEIALGAAYLAGVGAGLWSVEEIGARWRERARFEPAMPADQRASLLDGWRAAVGAVRDLAAAGG